MGEVVSGCPRKHTVISDKPSPEAKSDKILGAFIKKEDQHGPPEGEESCYKSIFMCCRK